MRVAILHEDVPADAPADEQDNLVQLEAVKSALVEQGHEVSKVPCTLELDNLGKQLDEIKPEAVFNLVESIDGVGRYIHFAATVLENLKYPYTGCPADALYITTNKLLAKRGLLSNGIRTPSWTTLIDLKEGKEPPSGQLIVKSVWEHASIGLDESSIVEAISKEQVAGALKTRLDALGGEAFAEQYIDGREFNLAILETEEGPLVLAPAEMCFEGYAKNKPKIVGYKAKWEQDSFEYKHTIRRFDFGKSEQALVDDLKKIALDCWRIFELRGYARVDFRVDEDGTPYVLEINANPCLSPDAGYAAAASQSGLGYGEIIREILKSSKKERYSLEALERTSCSHRDYATNATRFRDFITADDRVPVEKIARSTGMFSDQELEVLLEVFDSALRDGKKSGYFPLLYENDKGIVGFAIYGPIPCTSNSFDLYWIAVERDSKRQGVGSRILDQAEQSAKKMGGTNLYVDTAGRPHYESTRRFYEARGYLPAACIPDFYSQGDDKIIFSKNLSLQ